MKNTRLKFFVDTTVAVSALTGRNDEAWALLDSGRRGLVLLFVNEFIIKEIRWTLKGFRISQEKINYGIGYVMECCTIRKNVQRSELLKYNIRDKNDLPVIAGAVLDSAFLVTEDNLLAEDAKKYIESGTPGEALKKIC
ncbi:Uncharacterised protein [uncultured archaeon]|nr:Uncharacterised protein [uncultured archaeon]